MIETTRKPIKSLRNANPESLKELYISETGETRLFEFHYILPITGTEDGNEKIRDFKLQDN